MVQFCYLRLYFDIDNVSRRLLQWIARIENGLKRRPTTRYRTYSNQISTRLRFRSVNESAEEGDLWSSLFAWYPTDDPLLKNSYPGLPPTLMFWYGMPRGLLCGGDYFEFERPYSQRSLFLYPKSHNGSCVSTFPWSSLSCYSLAVGDE